MSVQRVPFSGGLSISESVSVEGPGRFTFVSGRIPLDDDGLVTVGTPREQAASVFDQLEQALDRAGSRLTDVVKLTVFLTDFASLPEVNAVRTERFGDLFPASSAVEVSALFGGAGLEIEAIAFTASPAA
jgi:2-iminobutanoate/2-iminopropanoate deaminase